MVGFFAIIIFFGHFDTFKKKHEHTFKTIKYNINICVFLITKMCYKI